MRFVEDTGFGALCGLLMATQKCLHRTQQMAYHTSGLTFVSWLGIQQVSRIAFKC